MPFRQQVHTRLQKLLKRVVFFANGGVPASGSYAIFMPFILEEEGQQIPMAVQIDDLSAFDDCLSLFQEEPRFQYFEPYALEQALKTLVAQAARQSQTLRTDKAIDAFIEGFYAQFGREARDYDIVFVLNGPVLENDVLAVGTARACTWSREQALAWGVTADEEDLDALIDHPLLILTSAGSSIHVAIEHARRSMESALDLLRVTLGWGGLLQTSDGTTIVGPRIDRPDGGRIREAHLQFSWTRLFAVRPHDTPTEAIVYRYESGQPQWPSLADASVGQSARSLLAMFNRFLVPTGNLQYGPEFKRAIEWMGSSMTRQRYDDQVVDLCTALECILARKDDRLKAEMLALRYAVLAHAVGNSYEPLNHLRASYLVRNEVIHGSEKDLAGPGHADTLMRAAIVSLLNVLQLAAQVADPPTTATDLIVYLDQRVDILAQITNHDLVPARDNLQLNKVAREHFKELAKAATEVMQPTQAMRLPATPSAFAAAFWKLPNAQLYFEALVGRMPKNGSPGESETAHQ